MSFSVIIPARHGSTRLKAKALREIAGKSLIQHVYECALRSDAEEVIIATDDERIKTAAEEFGASVEMTSTEHRSGTERLAEVVERRGYDDDYVLVNLQGDEPLMPASVINQVADNLAKHSAASAATVCSRIQTAKELFDPHAVKVIWDAQGFAIYFSRASIPWDRENFPLTDPLPFDLDHFVHIGIYAYRAGFLPRYVAWPPCHLEKMESLEQLRILWHGEKIHVAEAVEKPGPGVDTAEDLAEVERILSR